MFELVKGSTTAKLAVGRMDKNTTGFLLFTNDTDMMKIYFLVKNHQNIPSFSRQKLEI
jgi:23S rRNA pseudouridine2605 synthase